MTFEPTKQPVEQFEPVEAARPPAPPFRPAAPTPARGDRWFRLLLVFALVIAVGGVTFAVGRVTAPASASSGRNGNGFVNGGGAFPSGASASGALPSGATAFGRGGLGGTTTINGTVQSMANGTLTLQLADGSTVSVTLSGTTTYHSQAAATAGDVTAGKKVAVQVQFGGRRAPGPRLARVPGRQPGGQRTFSATDVMVIP